MYLRSLKKTILFLAILGIVFSGVFVFVSPSEVMAQILPPCPEGMVRNLSAPFNCVPNIVTDYVKETARDWGESLVKTVMEGQLFVAGVILWMAGVAFNASISLSIVHMANFVSSVPTINGSWTIIRDLINMSFIFILLYIAISTILGRGDNMKKLLMSVIIVALTINFSLFMTKIVIDASNIVALQFYKPLVPDAESQTQGGWETFANADRGLSNVFANAVKVSSSFNPNSSIPTSGDNPALSTGQDPGNLMHFVAIHFFGSIFLIILAFIFLAGAFLFLIRFVILILLMVFSPIAFLGFMLPQAQKASKMWWKNLTDQALFAPVFMIFMYLVARIVSSEEFQNLSGTATLSNAFIGAGSIAVILNFVVVCAFLIAGIVVSKSLASQGGNWAFKTAGSTTGNLAFGAGGWLGRKTFGGLAYRATQNEGFKDFAAKSRYGTMLYSGAQKTAKSSFDLRATKVSGMASAGNIELGKPGGKGGYDKYISERKKSRTDMAKSLGSGIVYKDRMKGEELKRSEEEAKKIQEDTKTDLDIKQKKVKSLEEEIGKKEGVVRNLEKSFKDAQTPEDEKRIGIELNTAKEDLASVKTALQGDLDLARSEREVAQETYDAAKEAYKAAKDEHEKEQLGKRGEVYAKTITKLNKMTEAIDRITYGAGLGKLKLADELAAQEIIKNVNKSKKERGVEEYKEMMEDAEAYRKLKNSENSEPKEKEKESEE